MPLEVGEVISCYNLACLSNAKESAYYTPDSAMFNYSYISTTMLEILLKKILFRYSGSYPFTHNITLLIRDLSNFIKIPDNIIQSKVVSIEHSTLRYSFFTIKSKNEYYLSEEETDSVMLFFIKELQKANSLLEV